MANLPEDLTTLSDDPVSKLLLSGRAETLHEAEEMYLDSCLPEVLELLRSGMTDDEIAAHPLMWMLRAHGSRWREDSLE